jgi:hypothetical protein
LGGWAKLPGKYNAVLSLNIDGINLGVRHFSRFLRSGPPDSQQFGTPLFYHHWRVPAVTAPASLRHYSFGMWRNLKRYYGAGDLHFITCSCYRRQPLLGTARRRDLLLTVLEQCASAMTSSSSGMWSCPSIFIC